VWWLRLVDSEVKNATLMSTCRVSIWTAATAVAAAVWHRPSSHFTVGKVLSLCAAAAVATNKNKHTNERTKKNDGWSEKKKITCSFSLSHGARVLRWRLFIFIYLFIFILATFIWETEGNSAQRQKTQLVLRTCRFSTQRIFLFHFQIYFSYFFLS
jgi:hypothetical protein